MGSLTRVRVVVFWKMYTKALIMMQYLIESREADSPLSKSFTGMFDCYSLRLHFVDRI